MKAYVINLPQSSDRRASIVDQLRPTGMDYELVDGVDGLALTTSDRVGLVDEKVAARYDNWLTPGAIGCALGHLRAYRRIIEADDPGGVAVVLEDDAIVSPTLAQTIRQISSHMRGAEVVLLYFRSFDACRLSRQDALAMPAGVRVMYPIDVRQPISAVGYLISVEACRRLAEVILPVRAEADSWGHFHELGAIDSIRCVIPRPVSVRNDFKSTNDRAVPHSLRSRATGLVARHRVFPLAQLLTLNRWRIGREMTRITLVQERSPLADAREQAGRPGAIS